MSEFARRCALPLSAKPKLRKKEIAMKAKRTLNTILGILAVLLVLTAVRHAAAVTLNPGDIVVANSGTVSVIDPQTGDLITTFCCFGRLIGVAIDANGNIIVADSSVASIIRIDPANGSQTTITSGNLLNQPTGLTIAGNGDLLVADMESCCEPATGRVVRVDPNNGAQTLVSSGASFVDPIGIEVEASGNILVADFNARTLWRVDPSTGGQTALASFFPDGEPYDVTVAQDGNVFIVDHNDRAVIKVDPVSGVKTTVSSGGLFDQPVGIAIENSGNILVTDFTSNAIIRVDQSTGNQTIVASGIPALANPWGIAVVPAPAILAVAIDIKPGSSPNTINLGSNGVVPVAILSSETFDATAVNPTSVALAGASVRLRGNGTTMSSLHDVNDDGRLDLIVQINTTALQLTDGDTLATLTAQTFEGKLITGSDSVRVVP
jgi:streptogramin lyase